MCVLVSLLSENSCYSAASSHSYLELLRYYIKNESLMVKQCAAVLGMQSCTDVTQATHCLNNCVPSALLPFTVFFTSFCVSASKAQSDKETIVLQRLESEVGVYCKGFLVIVM